MAQCTRFVCGHCGLTIDAWDDGNPYYIDARGRKRYAYHPHHDQLARCVGNDAEHVCLACGERFMVDSRQPRSTCPKCAAGEIPAITRLEGKRCPDCTDGVFAVDPDFRCES